MGTRHLTMVIRNNETKVAQYGQWDGYPTGVGQTIVEFLMEKLNLELFEKALGECTFLSNDEVRGRWEEAGAKPGNNLVSMHIADKFKSLYPELSRDTGAEVLELIQTGEARELVDSSSFAADSLFCEYAYVVDMDNKVLEIYEGFNTKQLTPADRFHNINSARDISHNTEYEPVKLCKAIPFDELTPSTMQELENELSSRDEETSYRQGS